MKCNNCGREMQHRDFVNRVVKSKFGEKTWIRVERVYCPICKRYKRLLPDELVPYKHYEKEIIKKAITDENVTDILAFEDYPCEMTIKRWNFAKNTDSILERIETFLT